MCLHVFGGKNVARSILFLADGASYA